MNKRVATTPLKANNIRRKVDSKSSPPSFTVAISKLPPRPSQWQLHFENWLLRKQLAYEQQAVLYLQLERQFELAQD